jgi:hypothetical protein
VREHRQQKVQVVKEAPAAKAVKSALAVEAVPVAKELLVAKEVRAESWQVPAPAVQIFFKFFGARGGTRAEGGDDDGTVLHGEGEDCAVVDGNEEDELRRAQCRRAGGAGAPVAATWTPNGLMVSVSVVENAWLRRLITKTLFDVARQRALA